MNRIIKFRAYWHKEKRMDYDPYGDEFTSEGTPVNALFTGWPFADGTAYLMQFTGLKDKNGKEIYEGDIVECEQMQGLGKFRGVVHFGVDERGYDGKLLYDARIYLDTRKLDGGASEKHGWGGEFCFFHYNPIILGNIYENPELLPTEGKGE